MDIFTGVVIASAFFMGQFAGSVPPPAHLTAACKVQTVKTVGSNISYDTYEHCLKK